MDTDTGHGETPAARIERLRAERDAARARAAALWQLAKRQARLTRHLRRSYAEVFEQAAAMAHTIADTRTALNQTDQRPTR